jgi:hypothetical protein
VETGRARRSSEALDAAENLTPLPGRAERTRSAPKRQVIRRGREAHTFAMRPSSKPSLPPHDAAQLLLSAQSENEQLPHLESGAGSSAISRAKSGAWKMTGARRGSARPQRHAAHREETRPTGPRRSMLERHGIRAMRSTSTNASEPTSHSVGPRLSAVARPMLRRAASLRFKFALTRAT